MDDGVLGQYVQQQCGLDTRYKQPIEINSTQNHVPNLIDCGLVKEGGLLYPGGFEPEARNPPSRMPFPFCSAMSQVQLKKGERENENFLS